MFRPSHLTAVLREPLGERGTTVLDMDYGCGRPVSNACPTCGAPMMKGRKSWLLALWGLAPRLTSYECLSGRCARTSANTREKSEGRGAIDVLLRLGIAVLAGTLFLILILLQFGVSAGMG